MRDTMAIEQAKKFFGHLNKNVDRSALRTKKGRPLSMSMLGAAMKHHYPKDEFTCTERELTVTLYGVRAKAVGGKMRISFTCDRSEMEDVLRNVFGKDFALSHISPVQWRAFEEKLRSKEVVHRVVECSSPWETGGSYAHI